MPTSAEFRGCPGPSAMVTYSVKTAGFSLDDQTGAAVFQDGKWKVADSTLCALVALAGTPPAVCTA